VIQKYERCFWRHRPTGGYGYVMPIPCLFLDWCDDSQADRRRARGECWRGEVGRTTEGRIDGLAMERTTQIRVLLYALPPLAWLWNWAAPQAAPPPEPEHEIVHAIRRLELRSQPGFAYPITALPVTTYRLRVQLTDGRSVEYDDEQYTAFRDRVRNGRLRGSDAESLDQILGTVFVQTDRALAEKKAMKGK